MAAPDPVARMLYRVLTLSLAPLAGACGGIDTSGFDELACLRDGNAPSLVGLTPAVGPDYLELRELPEFSGEHRTLETRGTPCATASDPDACAAAIAAATSTQGFRLNGCVDFCPPHILIVNTGDDVTILDSADAVRAWMAPVDAPEEAVLAARLAGYSVGCRDLERGGVKAAGEGYEVLGTRITAGCDPVETTLFRLSVDEGGNVEELESEVIDSESGACIGRRPAGLVRRAARGATRAGAYFAQVAHLEAASVRAFEVLRRELAHHGAPASLLARAIEARQDEVRHARVMRLVAARYGGAWRSPKVERRPLRSLEEIAVENAAEGCVREAFGAVLGMWQARFARDAAVRRVMRRVARDETRHASLAWAVDSWARPRLGDAARRRVEEARRGALSALREEARRGAERELVLVAGLPGARDAERLARHFEEAVAAMRGE